MYRRQIAVRPVHVVYAASIAAFAALLAEKAALEETVKLLSTLLREPKRPVRRFDAPALCLDEIALSEQLKAMRARYEAAESGEAVLTLRFLDEPAMAAIREKIITARRRLEDIGDRRRELNGNVLVEVDDEMLADLRAAAVI